MTYKLHMSGVITGSLNCFCLACDDFFTSPQDATDHIGTAEHQKKADAVQFSDKFQNDHVKKFKWGYYCEFCNVLMPTASKVNLHITEDEHKHNKGLLLLKPMGLDVVFNNVLIEECAWHGLIEGVCSLCNAEFEDENDHKNETGHSLNLVLKTIQFGAGNAIFRPLDEKAVQCLTCNKLLAPSKMSKHLDDIEHHELYAKRRIENNGICQETEAQENFQGEATNSAKAIENEVEIKKPKVDNDFIENNKNEDKNNNQKSPTKDKSKIIESIAAYQTKGININLETETAFCKKCAEVVTFDFKMIEKHIENHSPAIAAAVDSALLYPSKLDQNLNRVDINDKTTQSSEDNHEVENGLFRALRENVQNNSSIDEDTISICSDIKPLEKFENDSKEEASDFAKANKITYNGDNNQSFCRICKVHVPASFRSMKEHVDGANHKRLFASSKSSITQPKAPGNLSKQKTIEFIDSAYDLRQLFYIASIVNEKYCFLRSSFYLVSENNSRMRCFVCDTNLPPYSDAVDHIRSSRHQERWARVPVITSERNEFIREVRPELYHCGYCGLVVSGWTDMKLHLECSDHRINRTTWEGRLRQHMPDLRRHIIGEQFKSMISFFNMLN